MIYLSMALTWPFKYNPDDFKNYFCKTWQVTKHKFLEVESYGNTDDLISFVFRLAWRTDHEGIMIELGLFRKCISIQFYDSRHWNNEKNTYEVYEDEK